MWAGLRFAEAHPLQGRPVNFDDFVSMASAKTHLKAVLADIKREVDRAPDFPVPAKKRERLTRGW